MALQNDQQVMARVESLHEAVVLRLGLPASASEGSEEVVPFVSLVGPPTSCFGRSRDISLGVDRLLAEPFPPVSLASLALTRCCSRCSRAPSEPATLGQRWLCVGWLRPECVDGQCGYLD
jgi:hypothetical protein